MPNWQDFHSAALSKPNVTTDDINVLSYNGEGFRSIEINGRQMFMPGDVYRCIGAADPIASSKHFLRTARSTRAENWPYPGRKPRIIDTSGVLALLDSVRGVNKGNAAAFREWFNATVMPQAPAARMADIADKLDPDVQASLHAAFLAVQQVSLRITAALERRTELMASLAAAQRADNLPDPAGIRVPELG
ncbi:hypothetical protein [Tabrizicola sp.]|uniref:hypothetical protein n=1 Tax=Tabrizicola sp. TaxID=2005166 RepID=UPI002FDE13BC